ncbi:MAG: hypothetical protein R2847_10270 [Bacteroidia bacterium]
MVLRWQQAGVWAPLLYAKAPAIGGYRDFGHYAYNTPLCGQCNVVCPVRIDFTDIFLEHRHVMVQQKLVTTKRTLILYGLEKTMLKREFMNWKAVNPMRYSIETLFLKSKTGIRKTSGSLTCIVQSAVARTNGNEIITYFLESESNRKV